jgi:DNA repair exonuclease SbcCD ATPase subunit
MDITTALTLMGQATGIIKNLRDIDKGFDVATLKSQMAELYSTMADVKIALSDARETIHDKDKKIKDLEDKISTLTSGEACPICNEGRMKVMSSRAHAHFAFAGVQERTIKCEKCGHAEQRMFDPNGATKRSR